MLSLVSPKNLSLGFSSSNCPSTTIKKLILCRFPALHFSCLSLNATCNEQLCKGFSLWREWRSPQRALALQGKHCGAYNTHSQRSKTEQERQSGVSAFSFVCLLWKLQTPSTTCLCGGREEPAHWVRPKDSSSKMPPSL